jgi:hypothetical protein
MKTLKNILIVGALGMMVSTTLFAAKASVKIIAPANNAQFDAGEEYPLVYEVVTGDGGDHFHVWVDDDRGPGVHTNKGTYLLPKMKPGDHAITLKVVDKGHVPTGPSAAIKVLVK